GTRRAVGGPWGGGGRATLASGTDASGRTRRTPRTTPLSVAPERPSSGSLSTRAAISGTGSAAGRNTSPRWAAAVRAGAASNAGADALAVGVSENSSRVGAGGRIRTADTARDNSAANSPTLG